MIFMKHYQFKALRFFIYAFTFMFSSYQLNYLYNLVPGRFGFPFFMLYLTIFFTLMITAIMTLAIGNGKDKD